jgi:hypothetical protein
VPLPARLRLGGFLPDPRRRIAEPASEEAERVTRFAVAGLLPAPISASRASSHDFLRSMERR